MLAIMKLTTIQNELKAPKNQLNKFGGYNYRNCEDILEALKPLLLKHNSAVTLSDELVMVGDRFYVKATATLHCFSDNDIDTISVSAYAREDESKKGMDASQVTGASSSYARKYALNGLFAIDDTKDSDATNTGSNSSESKTPKQVPTKTTNEPKTTPIKPVEALSFVVADGITVEQLFKQYKNDIDSIYESGTDELKKAIDDVREYIAACKK
jgi:hypothetical protein